MVVKLLKLLEGSPSDLEKSNVEYIHTLGFRMGFYYIEYPQYMLYIWKSLLPNHRITNSYFK